MKQKEEEKMGKRECRLALRELEEAKKVTMEAVKKEDTLRKLWVEAQRCVERAKVKQEQYKLQEECECQVQRLKCSLARDTKAKMEDHRAGWQ